MTSAFQRLVEALSEFDPNLAAAEGGATAGGGRAAEGGATAGEPPAGGPGEPSAGGPGGSGRSAGWRPAGLLAEELARLLDAWQQGLRVQAGPDCRSCPVCQLVTLVRRTRPEVFDHLVNVVGELAAAVRLAAGQPETAPMPGCRSRAPVERIDVTD
jgi:hypothetical protein